MDTVQVRLTPRQIEIAADLIRDAREDLPPGETRDDALIIETRLRYRLARIRAGAVTRTPAGPPRRAVTRGG